MTGALPVRPAPPEPAPAAHATMPPTARAPASGAARGPPGATESRSCVNQREIRLTPPTTHRHDVCFPPAVGHRQCVHLVQQPLRSRTNLRPHKDANVQQHRPPVPTSRTDQVEQQLRPRIALGQTLREALHHSLWQPSNSYASTPKGG